MKPSFDDALYPRFKGIGHRQTLIVNHASITEQVVMDKNPLPEPYKCRIRAFSFPLSTTQLLGACRPHIE